MNGTHPCKHGPDGGPCGRCEQGAAWTADQCRLCWNFANDPRYRALWSGRPPPRPGPCVHLGPELGTVDCPTCGTKDGRAKVRVKVFECRGGYGQCTLDRRHGAVACCRLGRSDQCPGYAADDRFRARPDDPPCGVVVGVYWHVPLVELQVKAIRHFCGDVPILVSDDASPDGRSERMRQLCALYRGVDFVSSATQIGHAGGDLAAFSRGLAWAKNQGLRILAKLSQRFFPTVPRWLQDGARDLLASGLHLAGQSCVEGPHRFPLRTEACLLDVDAWHTPECLAYFAGRPTRNATEAVVWDGCRRWHDGRMHPWALLGGVDRRRPAPGILWHTNTPGQAYRDLAARFGVDLGPEFNVHGSHLLPGYKVG